MDSIATDLRKLLDDREIRRRLLDYCRGIDRCDAELVASVYHLDATDDHGSFKGLGSDFAVYATATLLANMEATLHFLGDSIIDYDDSGDVAFVETYVKAEHRRSDEQGPFLERFGGRYVDRFERRNNEWKIANRICIREWDAKERIELAFPPNRFTEGRRGDRTDPAYQR